MGKAAEALHDIADDPDAEIAKRDERIEQLEAELKEANEAPPCPRVAAPSIVPDEPERMPFASGLPDFIG